jgi:hypothetical protein
MEYYKLVGEDYTFYLTISKGLAIDTVSIGGKKGECVNICINKPESLLVQRGMHAVDIATIPILGWDSRCAVDKDLLKGSGTVTMICTILSEVQKRYPYVRLYTFTDNSHITCNNNKTISLLSLSIIEHRKSWYERNFNACLADSSMDKKYRDGIMTLDDPTLKMPFSEFTSIISSYTTPAVIRKLEAFYEGAPTYFSFFQNILETEGKAELCILVVDWVERFLIYIFQFNPQTAQWNIPSDSIKSVAILNESRLNRKPNNQKGGKRRLSRKVSRGVNINDILELSL